MRRVPDSNYPVRDLFGKGKHGFGPGDKTNGTIATIPGAAFMNAVQEEIANVIEGMGVALDPENNAQLLDVLKKRIAPLLGSIADLRAFSGGDKVKIVHVAGYHADSPGLGGGMFVADFDKTRGDDGGTVIVSADGTRWRRLYTKLFASDFGLRPDGQDKTAEFNRIAALNIDWIDCEGGTFDVSELISTPKFGNGFWQLTTEPDPVPMMFVDKVRADNGLIALGSGAAAANVRMRNCVAIGQDALKSNTYGRHNIAVGVSALHFVNGTSASGMDGTRNIGIGGNTGRFLTSGSRNIILGRDAAHCLVAAHQNIVIGNSAVMGDCPNTLTYGEIINQTPTNASYNVAIGIESSKYLNANYNTAIGYRSLMKASKSAGMVAIGAEAMANHESDRSYWDTLQYETSKTGTYAQNGSKEITVTITNHGLSTGDKVWLRFTSGSLSEVSYADDIWFDVVVVSTSVFTIQSSEQTTATGAAMFTRVATTTPYTQQPGRSVAVGYQAGNGARNFRSVGVGYGVGAGGLGNESVGVGYAALGSTLGGGSNTAVGAYTLGAIGSAASENVAVGTSSGSRLSSGHNNIAVGSGALKLATTANNNSAIGAYALSDSLAVEQNVAVGTSALRNTQAGAAHQFNNCVGLGYDVGVTGDNQVQIGNSAQTVYTFAPVQTRSDERDKADVRDISLGLDFINKLRPVDYRWDYRTDYITRDDNGEIVIAEKDGSKKRVRYHHGLIAQEVGQLIHDLGVDFGGYQDHALLGGDDVKSIAYEELIPILIKAVQDTTEMIKSLEAKIEGMSEND